MYVLKKHYVVFLESKLYILQRDHLKTIHLLHFYTTRNVLILDDCMTLYLLFALVADRLDEAFLEYFYYGNRQLTLISCCE